MSELLSILPVILILIGFLVFIKHRKNSEQKIGNKLGRRGRKDHLWLIIKEYLQKKGRIGLSVDSAYVFDRPDPKEIHELLIKRDISRAKSQAKLEGRRYKRPIKLERYPEEDYFDQLEKETQSLIGTGRSREHRKRYVIAFKAKDERSGILGDWESVEVEASKKESRQGDLEDVISVTKELDFEMESLWLLPLLIQRKKMDDNKKLKKSEIWRKRIGNLVNSLKSVVPAPNVSKS